MKLRVCKLALDEIGSRYSAGDRINDIASDAGVSRQAIYNILNDLGIHDPRRGTVEYKCLFCGASFTAFKSRGHAKYCSIPCYNADKDGYGYYGNRGTLAECEKRHGISVRHSRGKARELLNVYGKVVHHIDGDPFNNDHSNLMVFDDHASHMRYHAEQRNKKHNGM